MFSLLRLSESEREAYCTHSSKTGSGYGDLFNVSDFKSSIATAESVADIKVLVKGTHDAFFLLSADQNPTSGQTGTVNEIGSYSTQFIFDFSYSRDVLIELKS